MVVALGITWLLDGLEVTLAGSLASILRDPRALGLSDVQVGGAATGYLAGAVSGALFFGWLTYLLVRGFFARSGTQILLAVVLFLFWGGILLGVLPGQPQVSWQGHLFGALAGVFAASLVAPRRRAPAPVLGS